MPVGPVPGAPSVQPARGGREAGNGSACRVLHTTFQGEAVVRGELLTEVRPVSHILPGPGPGCQGRSPCGAGLPAAATAGGRLVEAEARPRCLSCASGSGSVLRAACALGSPGTGMACWMCSRGSGARLGLTTRVAAARVLEWDGAHHSPAGSLVPGSEASRGRAHGRRRS